MAVQFGFVDIEFLSDRTIEDVGYGIVREAIDRQLNFYNTRMNEMLGSLCTTTNLAQENIQILDGSGTLQDLDEDGNPLPTLELASYDVAYPLRWAGDAIGQNRLTKKTMTVQDMNDLVRQKQVKDRNFIIHHMLAALLTKTSYTWQDRSRLGYKGAGALTIQPLANNDSTTYNFRFGGANATDNHYLGFASAIADGTNPFPTIYTELAEHSDDPNPTVDCYIASDLETSTRALTDFVEVVDSQIRLGADERALVGSIPRGFGDEGIGRVDKVNIITMSALPSGYMFAQLRGRPPLAMRTLGVPGFEGLFTEEHDVDGNHFETRFLRVAGFGARDRVAAVAAYIGNGTYPNPTNYTAPIAAA